MTNMMLVIIATLVISTTCIELSQNEIDNVEQLLAQLKGTTQAELGQLEIDYQASHASKSSIIDDLQQIVLSQASECNTKDENLKDRQNDIQLTQAQITLVKSRIVGNNARVKNLKENRCAKNTVYVEGLRNQKISLRLVIFLRNALEATNDPTFSLIQQNQMGSFVVQFLSIYKHAKRVDLLSLTKEIEESFNFKLDIENDHLDSSSILIQTGSHDDSGTKNDLINILIQIEDDLRKSISNSQDSEVRVGIQLADFFASLELENFTLDQILGNEARKLSSFDDQETTAQNSATNCQNTLQQLKITVTASQNDLDSQTTLYDSQHQRLESELGVFDDVYRIYSTQVATSDDKFKSRVQDYVESFLSKIDYTLKASVAQAIQEQTAREVA